jgi:kynureninase
MTALDRAAAAELDRNDPLAPYRDAFSLPEGVIYLNGNSLGPLPREASARIAQAVEREWGEGLVTSWNRAGWFDSPARMGDQIAGLIGARAGEVLMADATGINEFKMVAAALALRPERRVVVMEGSNFPTDNYVVQGLLAWLDRGYSIRFAERAEIEAAIDEDVAAVALTHVHYKHAHVLDMKAITAKAHAAGAVTVWDLCHSAGVVPVDLDGSSADFAVGCTYKYLNGGPGSPAFLYVAERHQSDAGQPLTGWWGHAQPFAFERDYRPAVGIARMLTGTQPMLSMIGAEVGLGLAVKAGVAAASAKARAMGDLFIALVDERLSGAGFALNSPRDGAGRGGHVALDHANGYPIMKALIARGVIGDFRAPATLRFGFSPLPLRYVDVWDAVDALADIMTRETWRAPEFAVVEKVT